LALVHVEAAAGAATADETRSSMVAKEKEYCIVILCLDPNAKK